MKTQQQCLRTEPTDTPHSSVGSPWLMLLSNAMHQDFSLTCLNKVLPPDLKNTLKHVYI